MFVVCDPADALVQQFAHLAPEFIALHDIGTKASAVLLRTVAAAVQAPVNQLVIRRQGFGVNLATLEFVELPGASGGSALRLYGTQVGVASIQQQQLIAQALLGHSRLGVVIVGSGQSAHQIDDQLRSLVDAVNGDGWRNRQLLCMPTCLTAAQSLSTFAQHVRRGLNVLVNQLPIGGTVDWSVIQDVWAQIRAGRQPALAVPGSGPSGPMAAMTHAAPPITTMPAPPPRATGAPVLPLRPMPVVAPVGDPAVRSKESGWSSYVEQCAEIQGMVSCCVFELRTQRTLAFVGGRPGPASLASQGTAWHRAAVEVAKALGLSPGQTEQTLSLQDHHLLLLAMPGHPGVALHAVLDARRVNLTVARLKLQRIDCPPAP